MWYDTITKKHRENGEKLSVQTNFAFAENGKGNDHMKLSTRLCCAAAALALFGTVLCACGKTEEPAATSAPAATTAPAAAPTEAPAAAPTEAPAGAKAPATQAEWLDAYNRALSASGLACQSARQSLKSGTIGLRSKAVIDFSDPKYTTVDSEIAFRETFERDDKNGAALAALATADVQSVQGAGTTLTVTLRDCEKTDYTGQTLGGYVNILDAARAQTLGESVKNAVPDAPGSVKLKTSTVTLTGGKLVAEFNDDYTRLISVTVTGSERVQADFSYTLITVVADLSYDLESVYR